MLVGLELFLQSFGLQSIATGTNDMDVFFFVAECVGEAVLQPLGMDF